VELSSKGLVYPADHILSSGKVEIMYPGAQAEDILTNVNYINKGTVLDKYLEHLIVTDVNLDDMITADKDAVMVACRILGMGTEYKFSKKVDREPEIVTVDVSDFKDKEVDWSLFKAGQNEFSYTLPKGKAEVKFKLLNGHDIKAINQEEAFMKKSIPEYSADTSLVFKYSIVEVNGSRDSKVIRNFVDREMLQIDVKSLKQYIESITPGLVWKATAIRANNEKVEDLVVPYDLISFFWGA
jgi:hypothetical protein